MSPDTRAGTGTRVALREAAAALGAATAAPAHEARLLLSHVLQISLADLVMVEEVTAAQARQLDTLVQRRAAGEPIQHLTGEAWFRHIRVEVGPGVFIPRPETELVAGAAIDTAQAVAGRGRTPQVVELCAGSGAISAAVRDEVPAAQITAVEIDEQAIEWTRRNLDPLGIEVVHADFREALEDRDGQIDVVVVNPPYVPDTARGTLPVDVEGGDPDRALFAGPDGLAAIRAVEPVAARLLRSGGVVVCEHDDSHAESAPALFRSGVWREVQDHRDLAGRARFLTAVANGRM